MARQRQYEMDFHIAARTVGNPYLPEAKRLQHSNGVPRTAEDWFAWHSALPPELRSDELFSLAVCVGCARASSDDLKDYLPLVDRLGDDFANHASELAWRSERMRRRLDLMKGESDAMEQVRRTTWAAAFGEGLEHISGLQEIVKTSSVLIVGATGTGKELVARALRCSMPSLADKKTRWNEAPSAALSLAAIPSSLVASELFGHEKGAFTDAKTRKIGVLESCHEGVVFLDEVADLPADTQVSLLRCLQEGVIRRVGGKEDIRAAPRIVSATHKNLPALVQEGSFRADLYHRLASIVIRTPSLSERLPDIPSLLDEILERRVKAEVRGKVRDGFEKYCREHPDYEWPGNVRELHSAVRAIALGLPPTMHSFKEKSGDPMLERVRRGELKADEVDVWYAKLVRERSSNLSEAAQRLGVDRSTLRSRLGSADGQ